MGWVDDQLSVSFGHRDYDLSSWLSSGCHINLGFLCTSTTVLCFQYLSNFISWQSGKHFLYSNNIFNAWQDISFRSLCIRLIYNCRLRSLLLIWSSYFAGRRYCRNVWIHSSGRHRRLWLCCLGLVHQAKFDIVV